MSVPEEQPTFEAIAVAPRAVAPKMEGVSQDEAGETFNQPRVVLPTDIDLRAHGINREQAADLRARLIPFAEDWEQPEMDIYDDYDAARISAARISLGPAETSPRGTR